MHQFVQAGISLYNPDKPQRPVNSPYAVYQIAPALLEVLRMYKTDGYRSKLEEYFLVHRTLAQMYAKERQMALVPLKVKDGLEIALSAGDHSLLIKAIVEEFAPRFVARGRVVYVGDTGDKYGYFDRALLAEIGVVLDNHGKLPDVVIYCEENNWLFLIESVTSHGPVDSKRECLPRGEAHVGVGVDGRVRLILKFCGCDGAEASGGSRMVVRASQGDGPAGTISSKIGQAERNNFTN